MDYCVNNQIFYFNLFNPPKQLEQQTLINQTFNPQASNTYAQTDDKNIRFTVFAGRNAAKQCRKICPEGRIKLISELPGTPIQLQNFRSSSATITPISLLSPDDKTTSLNAFNFFQDAKCQPRDYFFTSVSAV